ncbi:hypothetical protein [Riemerella anatipestifer]|uniref:hypothetical protein n=1 Tax=Riemerella anatipestifer TaxID=34085 RepID=UPI0023637D9A|nr:hypothetical protein [Riemerella anatipestifer]MDD1523796.1 hypothetical protein [Riemerella anatipestifer]
MAKKVYVNFNDPRMDALMEEYLIRNPHLLDKKTKRNAYESLQKKSKTQPLTQEELQFIKIFEEEIEADRIEAENKKAEAQHKQKIELQNPKNEVLPKPNVQQNTSVFSIQSKSYEKIGEAVKNSLIISTILLLLFMLWKLLKYKKQNKNK